MSFREQVAFAYKAASLISRASLYGSSSDNRWPNSLSESAETPYLGFVGKEYQSGGTLIVASNPGGGGDSQTRTKGDELLEQRILAFRAAPLREVEDAFDEVTAAYLAQLENIPLRKIVDECILRAKVGRGSVAFFNLFPFRTRDNEAPGVDIFRLSAKVIGRPLVAALQPSRVLFLGLGMGRIATEIIDAPKKYVIERSRGDKYIAPGATETLDRIESESIELSAAT